MYRFALTLAMLGLAGLQPVVAQSTNVRWKKTVVDRVFRSEGVAAADVNKDGTMDILVGDFWYEAPDWKMHPIRQVRGKDAASPTGFYGDGLKGYSECMLCWADDVNGDGWPDQIVIGFPGKPAYWYENPKGKPGLWKEHVIWHSACNETPQFVDLFGTGKRVLVMGWQPLLKLASDIEAPLTARKFSLQSSENMGQMAWFAPGKDSSQLWEMHPISEPSTPGHEVPGTQKFSHGLGVGDMNKDGRPDVICTGGWWEQPSHSSAGNGSWPFHPAKLGEACADMIAYDLDGDTNADVISSSAHRFGIWAHMCRPGSNNSKSFLKQDLFPKLVSETHAMHCVDIEGDGLKDLVTGKRWWSHGRNEPGSDAPSMLYWFQARRSADGLISFHPMEIDSDSGIGTQFVVTDFNGDGKPDVITSNKKGVFLCEQIPVK